MAALQLRPWAHPAAWRPSLFVASQRSCKEEGGRCQRGQGAAPTPLLVRLRQRRAPRGFPVAFAAAAKVTPPPGTSELVNKIGI